jgi:hypothetical protein
MPDLNALIRSLKASQEKVGREKQAFMNNVGKQMADEVKRNTPVDTGNLRDSIHHEISGDTISITTDVVYAPYVDKGHATKGGTFVPGRHMFTKAMLKADAVVDPEVKRFLSKINLLG